MKLGLQRGIGKPLFLKKIRLLNRFYDFWASTILTHVRYQQEFFKIPGSFNASWIYSLKLSLIEGKQIFVGIQHKNKSDEILQQELVPTFEEFHLFFVVDKAATCCPQSNI